MLLPPPNEGARRDQPGVTAQGRPVDLVASEEGGRDLSEVLKIGSVVSGRVVERFDNGAYLFALRGRHLIAESRVPLLRDSVVRFVVTGTDDTISLRPLDAPTGQDRLDSHGAAAVLREPRLAALPQAPAAVEAFATTGAPLDAARLQAAARHAAEAPPAQQPVILAAHALLARHGLPATPALLALAQQAVSGTNRSLVTVLQDLASRLPPPSAPAGTPAAAPATSPASSAPTTPAAPPAPAPVPTHPPAPAAPPSTAPLPGTNGLATAAANTAGLQATSALIPDLEQGVSQALRQALALAGIRVAQPSPPSVTDAAGAQHPTPQALPPGSPHSSQTNPSSPPAAATSQPAPTPVPLTMSLLEQLARLSADPPSGAGRDEIAASVVEAGRQIGADLLLPPPRLADYDTVLPLVLAQGGAPVPARIAVSRHRRPNGGTATFLRVDAELSALGPVSIRCTGVDHLPLSIVLLATGAALRSLTEARDTIIGALREQGLAVSLRVDDLLAEMTDG